MFDLMMDKQTIRIELKSTRREPYSHGHLVYDKDDNKMQRRKWPFQWVMLGGVYSIRKNNVSGPLAHNINKDQFLMNCRSEHTGKTYKLIEETENIMALNRKY